MKNILNKVDHNLKFGKIEKIAIEKLKVAKFSATFLGVVHSTTSRLD